MFLLVEFWKRKQKKKLSEGNNICIKSHLILYHSRYKTKPTN